MLASDGAAVDPAVLAMIVLGALLVIPAVIADQKQRRRLSEPRPRGSMDRLRERHELECATRDPERTHAR